MRRFFVALLLAFEAMPAAAADVASAPRPRPIPEPLVAESITNIEGAEAGEIEFDVGALLLSRASGTSSAFGLEAEWRATDRLGLALEASLTNGGPGEPTLGQIRTGLAWSLLHDAARGFHLQAEATARFGRDEGERAEGPTELPHPYSGGVRAALRSGALTLRGGAGASFGDGASGFLHLAVLCDFGSPPRGFAGVELNTNVGAGPPLSIVPEIFVTLPVFGAPVDFGVGLPWTPGLRSGEPASIGGILRVVLEP